MKMCFSDKEYLLHDDSEFEPYGLDLFNRPEETTTHTAKPPESGGSDWLLIFQPPFSERR